MANSGTVLATGTERRLTPRRSVVDSHLVSVDLAFQSAALLLDLSQTGMGVQALVARPKAGTTTELHFQLPESDLRVDGVGTVAWSDASGRLGIHFNEIAEMCRPQLEAWVAREQPSPLVPGPTTAALPANEIALLRREVLAQNVQGDEALAFVLERIRSVSGATGAAIAVEDAGAFLCRVSTGAAPAVGASINPSSGLSGECVSSGEIVRCDDTESDTRVDRIVCRALHLRSLVIVPIKTQARLIGVLEVFSSHAHAFKSSDVVMLRDAAGLIAEFVAGKPAAVAAAAAPVAAAPVPVAAAPRPAAQAASAAPSVAAIADVVVPAPEEWPQAVDDEPELPLRITERLVALPRGIKFVAALAVIMIAASAVAGWHWGLVHKASPPAEAITTPTTTTTPAAPAQDSVAQIAASAAPTANLAASAPAHPASPAPTSKSASEAKPKTPVLVLSGAAHPAESSAPEPPPAITVPTGRGTEALTTVLTSNATLASLAPTATSHGVTGGKLIRQVDPVYPPSARSMRLSGSVVLKAMVDVHGRVSDVSVVSGIPLLAGAAANAVRAWRYQPFMLNGVPIPNEVTVRVNFAPKD